MDGMTNDDVHAIKIASLEKFSSLPQNLTNFFKNFIAIEISDTNLKNIHPNDLENFTKLRFLKLSGNPLTTLEADVFKLNPDLETIDLRSNNISQIDTHVFSHLKKLETLLLEQNPCSEMLKDAHSVDDVEKVVTQIESDECSTESKSGNNITSVVKEIFNLKHENQQLIGNFTNLRIQNQELLTEIEILNLKLNKLNETLMDRKELDLKYQELKAIIVRNEADTSTILQEFQDFKVNVQNAITSQNSDKIT